MSLGSFRLRVKRGSIRIIVAVAVAVAALSVVAQEGASSRQTVAQTGVPTIQQTPEPSPVSTPERTVEPTPAPTTNPTFVSQPSVGATRDWIDHLQAWSALAGAVIAGIGVLVAVLGLGGVLLALRDGRKQQRIEVGPYVRVDIGPLDGTVDFEPPSAHFINDLGAIDLAPDTPKEHKVSVYGWVSNYQPHPLGFALAVRPFFVASYAASNEQDSQFVYLETFIPYLECGKPVAIELFRIDEDCTADIRLLGVEFHDFYDVRHEYWFGQESTNALHGRLSCQYGNQRFVSTPAAWPRGANIDLG